MKIDSVFFRVTTFSRRQGDNSLRKAAYRSGERLVDPSSRQVFDYRRKVDVVRSEIAFPVPTPYTSRQLLWAANEDSHRRKDSQVSREFLFAIPRELPDDVQENLVREMANWIAAEYRLAVDWALHRPANDNPHVHMHTPTRVLGHDGHLGEICTAFSNPLISFLHVRACRAKWAEKCNAYLEMLGSEKRVDARPIREREHGRESLIHEGPSITALRRRNLSTRVSVENDVRKRRNFLRRAIERIRRELDKLHLEKLAAVREWVAEKSKKLAPVSALDTARVKPERAAPIPGRMRLR